MFHRGNLIAAFVLAAAMVMPACATSIDDISHTEEIKTEKISSWAQGDGYLRESEELADTQDAENNEILKNSEFTLSVPTYITQLDNNYFIVDCYHDQIIYSDSIKAPLNEWNVLTRDCRQPHTMAGDGKVILVDDTENNRVLVFEKSENGYVNSQLFTDIGSRPHYSVYDEAEKAFYVWSSMTGEMYVFRHEENSSKMYLTEIIKNAIQGEKDDDSDDLRD